MKKIVISLLFVLAGQSISHHLLRAEEIPIVQEKFRKKFEEAIQAKSENDIDNLFCWDGVTDKRRGKTLERMKELFRDDITGFEWESLPEDFEAEQVSHGIRYRPNFPILGFIRVGYPGPFGTIATSLPYGKKGDSFCFTSAVEEIINEVESKEILLGITIIGNMSYPNQDSFEGYCNYFKNGKENKQEFNGNGNYAYAVWGDGITYCEVRKTSGNSPIGLVVTEDGQEKFKSGMVATNSPIIYKAQ